NFDSNTKIVYTGNNFFISALGSPSLAVLGNNMYASTCETAKDNWIILVTLQGTKVDDAHARKIIGDSFPFGVASIAVYQNRLFAAWTREEFHFPTIKIGDDHILHVGEI